jgi:hypothetical protein
VEEMKRTKYTSEFKEEAVKQVIDKGHSVVDVAHVNKDGYLDLLNTDYGQRKGIGFSGPIGFDYMSTDWRGPLGVKE